MEPQTLSSKTVYYAEAAASDGSQDERQENVYLISSQGSSVAIGINDAVLASVSPLCRDILVLHQNSPEPPDDRYNICLVTHFIAGFIFA